MTIRELKKQKHGTAVYWARGDEQATGYLVDLRKSRPNAEPPLLYIQWPDGQRTDSADEWALEHVSLKQAQPCTR